MGIKSFTKNVVGFEGFTVVFKVAHLFDLRLIEITRLIHKFCVPLGLTTPRVPFSVFGVSKRVILKYIPSLRPSAQIIN
jgi:hypothetical protein